MAVFSWDRDVPLRYVMTGSDEADLLARCADVAGLFVEVPPWPRERLTLVGVEPASRLVDLSRGAPAGSGSGARGAPGGSWLGNLLVTPVHPGSASGLPAYCWYGAGCTCEADLRDVTLVEVRASGLFDVDLEAVPWIDPYDEGGVCHDPPSADLFRIRGVDGELLGTCRTTLGVYWERPWPDLPPLVLVGCLPEPGLRRLVAAPPGAASARGMIRAVTARGEGLCPSLSGAHVDGHVTAVRPSPLGVGLVDVEFDCANHWHPMPPGAREVWDLWFRGGPRTANEWASHEPSVRREWVSAALDHGSHGPDRPAGWTFHLDGRFVTDLEGFHCALGEAINGPGGYFGGNLASLADCLGGGFGATSPFTLVWQHSEIARTHLTGGYDRHRLDRVPDLDHLVRLLGADTVVLR